MSRPIVDHKGRRRCKTVAFRISPEEADQLDLKVALSGLSKQDYITKCLLESLDALSSFAGSFAPEESPVETQDMLIKNLGRPKGTGRTD